VSIVRLIVATRSSGPPASGKIIKEMTGSVASGTLYRISVGYPDNICRRSPNELKNIFFPLHPEGHIRFPKYYV
jgi:hypothetical protein